MYKNITQCFNQILKMNQQMVGIIIFIEAPKRQLMGLNVEFFFDSSQLIILLTLIYIHVEVPVHT